MSAVLPPGAWQHSCLGPEDTETCLGCQVAAHAPPAVIDVAHLERQREWSTRNFGPHRRTEGILRHIAKEMDEVRADPTSLEEWVDIAILALDGAWRAGHEPQAIIDGLIAKQEENFTRSYPDWRTVGEDEPIEHVREGVR